MEVRRPLVGHEVWSCPACRANHPIDQARYQQYVEKRDGPKTHKTVTVPSNGRRPKPTFPYRRWVNAQSSAGSKKAVTQPREAGPALIKGYTGRRPYAKLPNQSDFD